MSKRSDLIFVEHILDSIKDIEDSIRNLSKGKFVESKDLKDATIRRIEIIGEAAKNITEGTKKKYPEVEWKKIVGTRDRLIHAYFSVDLDITWDIIKHGIPILKKQVAEIKKELLN